MNTLALLREVVIGVNSGQLVDSLRAFIAPILLFAVSCLSITFLFRRQFMQMATFAVIAVVVFILFYKPQILGSLGQSFGEANKDLTWN